MSRRHASFVILALAVLASGLLVVRLGAKHVSVQGIQFEVPPGWAVRTGPWPSMTSTGLAFVGTLPWGDCAPDDINCHYRERLSRNEIEVDVSFSSFRLSDFCTFAKERPDLEPRGDGIRIRETHYLRIDGRPAISVDYSFDTDGFHEADGWRKWMIAPAGTTEAKYELFAKWRGPDGEELVAALDHLVSTIKIDPSPYGASAVSDCGDPFPPAT